MFLLCQLTVADIIFCSLGVSGEDTGKVIQLIDNCRVRESNAKQLRVVVY